MVGSFMGRPEGYAVPVIFAMLFFVGALGTGTLIFNVARNETMRNNSNSFIVSLALGAHDLSFCVHTYSTGWRPIRSSCGSHA